VNLIHSTQNYEELVAKASSTIAASLSDRLKTSQRQMKKVYRAGGFSFLFALADISILKS
jgi:hypothetical protein